MWKCEILKKIIKVRQMEKTKQAHSIFLPAYFFFVSHIFEFLSYFRFRSSLLELDRLMTACPNLLQQLQMQDSWASASSNVLRFWIPFQEQALWPALKVSVYFLFENVIICRLLEFVFLFVSEILW